MIQAFRKDAEPLRELRLFFACLLPAAPVSGIDLRKCAYAENTTVLHAEERGSSLQQLRRWFNAQTLLLLLAAALLLWLQPEAKRDTTALTEMLDTRSWTVHVIGEADDYKLAKWEPEQGVYLGAYVLQDQSIHGSMETFNELTGRRHASFFKYVGYGEPYPKEWVEQVVSAGAFPQIALEPNGGLEQVRDDEYLRQFADEAGKAGVPVFLRFASEMNGTWTAYSGDPKAYIETWRLVHDVFEQRASNVAMVWTVLNVPEKPIRDYYPGDHYVDWVGLNMYSVKYHDNDMKKRADQEDPLAMLDYVYNQFSRNKPIQISEFGATHYNVTDGRQDNGFAADKIARLYEQLEYYYPRLKAVYYFDVNNLTEYNQQRKINDYSITQEPELLDAYSSAVKDDYFLSDYGAAGKEGTASAQRFTFRGNVYEEQGTVYADLRFFTKVLDTGLVRLGGGTVRLIREADNGKPPFEAAGRLLGWHNASGYLDWAGRPIMREGFGLALVQTAKQLGYKVKLKGTDIVIEE